MRGPGYRHDLDVRRLWRCPHCGKQRRLPGDITVAACSCGQTMQLVEQPSRKQYTPQPLAGREFTVASFALTEEELARPVVLRTPPKPRDDAEPEPAATSPAGRSRPGRKPRRNPAAPGGAERQPTGQPEPAAPPAVDSAVDAGGDDGFGAGLDEPSAS